MNEAGLLTPDLSSKYESVVSSRFNFAVPTQGGFLIYNANSGAIIRLSGRDSGQLAEALSSKIFEIDRDSLPEELFTRLEEGGFLIASGTDEVANVRERYLRSRRQTPIVLTLTTTMDCNLGCYYCYESRSGEHLQLSDVPSVVTLARSKLLETQKKSLHVDWYGGEPLLNLPFMLDASRELRKLCSDRGVLYSASIISNGTEWPEDKEKFIEETAIRQVQISFDGLRQNHDRRRHFRLKNNRSSFDEAVALVDSILDFARVDIRVNLDRWNQDDLLPLVEFARSRGWFGRKFPAVIQPARLASYSQRSSFMRKIEFTADEYETLRHSVRARAAQEGFRYEEAEVPDQYPYPKTSVCAALAYDSEVIGPDGLKYRCGLQVGETHRAVGNLRNSETDRLSERSAEADWWNTFDPTVLPNCSRCSFLPICLGGCPKMHLEKDTHALEEQSLYWRKNLPRLIGEGVKCEIPADYVFTEEDQFR